MSHLARIADLVLDQPLLITPSKAEVIASVLAGRIGINDTEMNRFEGRGARLTDAKARATEAHIFTGQDAVAAGLADRVGTFDQVLAQLRGARPTATSTASQQKSQAAPMNATTTFSTAQPAPVATTPSTAGWAAEYRGSPSLQREFISEESYVAMKRFDAKKTGTVFVESASVDDKQPDPHVAAWHASADLQREFITAESYAALMRAEARGNGRVHKGATVTGR